MSEESIINFDSPSVQSYMEILQGIINRMAANCTSCKTWCVTLVSAIIIVVIDKGNPLFIWIAAIPVVLFLALDSYYLGLERLFRDLYNDFMRKLHSNKATVNDVFIVNPGTAGDVIMAAFKATASLSVWPFYGLLLAMLSILFLIIA